jgi:hypothetical protein
MSPLPDADAVLLPGYRLFSLLGQLTKGMSCKFRRPVRTALRRLCPSENIFRLAFLFGGRNIYGLINIWAGRT